MGYSTGRLIQINKYIVITCIYMRVYIIILIGRIYSSIIVEYKRLTRIAQVERSRMGMSKSMGKDLGLSFRISACRSVLRNASDPQTCLAHSSDRTFSCLAGSTMIYFSSTVSW